MSANPLISVIIPFYNRTSLVLEAIKKISLQSYKNIEVILIDDGSSELLKMSTNFGLNIQIKRLQENRGPGYARREGRILAKGEYVCYLDSDDWWSRDFIEECIKTLEEDKLAGMAFANTVTIYNGAKVDCRVKDSIPQNILPTLFVNNKRFWSTASCVWRSEVSLPEHWMDFRNHEDYIHDILSSRLNNTVKYVKKGLTFKNQSAPDRIPRDGEEVRKALNEILRFNEVSNIRGLSYFYLNRIHKNKLRIKPSELPKTLRLPSREFKIFSKNWFLFHGLVLLNIFGVTLEFQKKNINKLKE